MSPRDKSVAKPNAFTSLNGLRFFAAMAVVFFHYAPKTTGYDAWPYFFRNLIGYGPAAVGFFFILSGFVLAFRHVPAEARGEKPTSFYWSRFARIYPAYCFGFLLFAPIAVKKYLADPTPPGGLLSFLAGAALYLLMLQAWTPFSQAWNGPGWSVSDESFMYALFPFVTPRLMRLGGRKTLMVAATSWLVVLVVVSLYVAGAIPSSFWQGFVMNSPSFYFPLFVIGICLAKCLPSWRKVPRGRANLIAAASILGVILLATFWPASWHDVLIAGGMAPLLALVILSFTSVSGWLATLTGGPLLDRLGQASYVMYIIQAPLWHYWEALTNLIRHKPIQTVVVNPWQFFLFLPCLILSSLLLERFVEMPVRRWLAGFRTRPANTTPLNRSSASAAPHSKEEYDLNSAPGHVPPMSLGFAPVTRKTRVLIIPNASSWIIGQMAAHIMREYEDRYEFWLVTDKIIRLRPDLMRIFAASVDFIFPLTDKGYQLLKQAVRGQKLPPSILWLHHVTSWNEAMRDAVKNADEIIACTDGWRQRIASEAETDAPVTTVPHGVDAAAFRRLPSRRREFGIPENSFVVGFVGSKTSNFDEGRKGLDTLHQILRSARINIPDLHIAFLGLGWEREVASLRAQGISANYVGFIPESRLPEFYCSIDAYLLTSRVEGGPCTVLEAMACETPVVTTRVGLVPQVIEDGVTGFSADAADSETLVAALCALYASPSLRKQVGEAARAKIVDSRSWSATLRFLDAPFSRMTARSFRMQKPDPSSTATSGPVSRSFASAVHTIDGLLWGIMSCAQRVISPIAAVRLIRSCWEGYALKDIVRGLYLIGRLNYRSATIRKILAKTGVPSSQDVSLPKQACERSGVATS